MALDVSGRADPPAVRAAATPESPGAAAHAGWLARLQLDYRRCGPRTVARDHHEGPLRVLQALYPEGPGICHHVMVHPPGGLVGGDRLDVDVAVQAGAHALLTTPGAARFYRSEGGMASQHVRLRLEPGARLEWLPLETLAYDGCAGENRLQMDLEGEAETIGWDVLALGLPAAGLGFHRGVFAQHLELSSAWLEHGRIAATDRALREGPAGLAGRRVLGTLWFARGEAIAPARIEALLAQARAIGGEGSPPGPVAPSARLVAGATSPDPRIIVLRVLADRVEPVMEHLAAARAAWRHAAWGLPATRPRIWRT